MTTTSSPPIRALLAKPGLDGHDRGVKVIALALRDAGVEVIYLGLRQTPEMIVGAAVSEDVDVIGISILSGAHLALTHDILALLKREGRDVPLIVGGTIPPADGRQLLEAGVDAVCPVGMSLAEVVQTIMTHGRRQQ